MTARASAISRERRTSSGMMSSVAASKEYILHEIRRLAAENGGKPLGKRRFEAATGVRESAWLGRFWSRWSDAVQEAGFAPGEWQGHVHGDDELLRLLADLTREFGHVPTAPELRMARRERPDVPNDKTFRNRLGSKEEQTSALLAFAQGAPGYSDVAAICLATMPRSPRVEQPKPDRVVTGAVYLLRMGEFHKIGKSNDPGRRLYEVGLRLPEKHDLVHIIETDDPSGIEAYWHRRFASQRANGEWFRLSPGDVAAFTRRSYM